MPHPESARSEPEQTLGLRGPSTSVAAASDPPSPMDEWWKTPPSLVPPPAVDPAIYGIDASDVGLDHEGAHRKDAQSTMTGLSGAERIEQMLARTDIQGGLDERIGLASPMSAQSGGPPKTREDHMLTSDGHRAEAMAAQLQLAAKGIDDLRKKLERALETPMGERSPDAVTEYIVAVLADVKQEREALALIFREQKAARLDDRIVRQAVLQASRASKLLEAVVHRAEAVATRAGATTSDLGRIRANSRFVKADVGRIAGELKLDGADDTKAPAVDDREAALQLVSARQSLDGLDESSQALVLAMGERDPQTAMSRVLPGLMSNARILEASLVDGMRPDREMMKISTRIANAMQKAWRDAKPSGLHDHSALRSAHDTIPMVLEKLTKLGKGKK